MKIFLLTLAAAGLAFAQPTVTKVEPPNWWTQSKLNPIRMLIRGTNLTGATVSSDLKTANVKTNASGTYLFFDAQLPTDGKAGPHPFQIHTTAGDATAQFELLDPLPKEHRFAGLTPDDVVYLIMPDRFANGDKSNDDPAISHGLFDPANSHFYHGGDFKGIKDHLGYLKALGVTTIWLTPWYDNVNHLNEREMPDGKPITDYHGYGAVDFYGVEEHFGTLQELRDLVDAAHALGMKVEQDEVANHCGPYHPWVTDPPTPTWFHGTLASHINETWQLWPLIDFHSTPQLRAQTLDGWFANILPDLNQDDPEVTRYLTQNTLWWIGITGLDAIRMDTLPYVPRPFWNRWMSTIKLNYPQVTVVGEVFDADPAITSFFQGGAKNFDGVDTRVDAVFDFPNYFKARDVFAHGKSIRDLAGMLGHDGLYSNPGVLGTFIGNHDVVRFMNETGATVPKLELALTWLLTTRGIPTIYYGDEIAMQGGRDPDNRRDFPESAFMVPTRTPEQRSIYEYVQKLLRIRSGTPALRRGQTTTLCATEQQWVYARMSPQQTALIELNNSDDNASIACKTPPMTVHTILGPGTYGGVLPPHSARISVTQDTSATPVQR